jgi:hypothetical protein
MTTKMNVNLKKIWLKTNTLSRTPLGIWKTASLTIYVCLLLSHGNCDGENINLRNNLADFAIREMTKWQWTIYYECNTFSKTGKNNTGGGNRKLLSCTHFQPEKIRQFIKLNTLMSYLYIIFFCYVHLVIELRDLDLDMMVRLLC